MRHIIYCSVYRAFTGTAGGKYRGVAYAMPLRVSAISQLVSEIYENGTFWRNNLDHYIK